MRPVLPCIENQKELIQRYISCKESLQNVPVMDFVDDGYTGSNFDRPGSLFGMVFLSAGQCAIGNGDAFVPDAAITGDGSTSNADWWIRDFYDTAGGRQRDRASGTGGSNASAGMVHIK